MLPLISQLFYSGEAAVCVTRTQLLPESFQILAEDFQLIGNQERYCAISILETFSGRVYSSESGSFLVASLYLPEAPVTGTDKDCPLLQKHLKTIVC